LAALRPDVRGTGRASACGLGRGEALLHGFAESPIDPMTMMITFGDIEHEVLVRRKN
jgi:hypothetical protein